MSVTPNFAMPLLHAAQAQKEITHNEALMILDALLPGVVIGIKDDPEALSPSPGDVWIVGSAPVGAWAGYAGRLAIFTEGGWRFAPAPQGMQMLDREAGVRHKFDSGGWNAYPVIAEPAGGTTVDIEARETLSAVLATLRLAGLAAVT